MHRTEIVEGQERNFQISNIPSYPAYYLRIKALNSPYTAEAADLTATTDDRRGRAQTITPGSDGPQAYAGAYSRIITFEVTANADSPSDTDDETFGVQLCTTASCTGGTILGEWMVTIREAPPRTVHDGTGGSVVHLGIPGLSVMEASRNGDSRDRQATITVNVTTAPTSDIVIVAKASAGVKVGTNSDGTDDLGPIARVQGGLSLDNQPSAIGRTANPNFDAVTAEYVVGYWASGATGSKTVTVIANDNVVDTAGGTLSGNLEFRVLNDDANYRTNGIHKRYGGTGSDTGFDNATVYSSITIPNVPIVVTHDDEPTRVKVLAASSADNEATEGSSTDTATFRVQLERALVASEEVTVPLRFSGAALGTNFTLALDGSPTGASYADSSDGTEGRLTFSGAGAQEATVVVTAISDSDSVSETLGVFIPQYSEPWRANYLETNLDGGACAGRACPGVGSGDAPERGYQITLREATPGLTVIDTGDRRVDEGGTYSYTVRLNTAPSANVTVAVSSGATSAATVTTGGSLTFTPSGGGAWNVPQTVTVTGANNNTDAADALVAITHDVSGSGTYASIADVTHDLIVVDDDATTVTMAGAGLRTSGSSTNISEVMVEGDTTRVDRSLTIALSRPLGDGEYVKVPLYVAAEGHPATPDSVCDLSPFTDIGGNQQVPSHVINNCDVISSPRGVRVSASVSYPPHYNDMVMTATGVGVGYQHVPRVTGNHNGYRYIEFRGAGAQTATVEMHARGFDDRDTHDEQFRIEFANDFLPLNATPPLAYSLKPLTNLGGGIEAWMGGAEAWFGIADAQVTLDGIVVPVDSSIVPSGVGVGEQFRLLYVTSQTTTASSGNIGDYDTFVRAEITGNDLVSGGVTALAAYADSFKAIAETRNGVAARDNAQFNPNDSDHPDVPIYWVGGSKVADDNADFTDGEWDDEANPRTADGVMVTPNATGYWTGTDRDGDSTRNLCDEISAGRRSTQHPRLGQSDATAGLLNSSHAFGFPLGPPQRGSGCGRQHGYSHNPTEMRPMYALSGLFSVDAAGVTVGGTTTDEHGHTARTPFVSAAEGSDVVFTVTLTSPAPSGGITVPYTLADGLGIATDPAYTVATSADYADAGGGSITIAQGDTTGAITVNTTADTTYEGNHYFMVMLGTPSGTNAPPLHPNYASATGVIQDDADAPTVQFSAATASVAENVTAGTVSLTVERSSGSDVPAAVTWTTADGTGGSAASHPGDYTAATGIIEFAAGETSKTIAIDIVDDGDAESAETFTVTLSEPVDATLGSQASATVTVTDDDGAAADVMVSWSQTDDTALPPAPDLIEGQTYTVKVSLSSPAPVGGVVIPISVMELTGADSADYTVPTGVTIAAGQTSTTFDFVAVADENAEANGLLILTLCPAATCPMGYTSGDSLSFIIKDPDVVTVVTDDDGNPIEVPALTVDEGASETFTVMLEIDPVVDATITLKAVDDSSVDLSTLITSFVSVTATDHIAFDTDPDTPGNQNTLTFTGGNGGNWNVARTVTVYALYDDDVDTTATSDYTVGFLNSAASGPYKEQVFFTRVPLGVWDAGKAVVVDPATVSVATSGTVTYDLQLASDPGGSVTVTPTSGDATKATVTGEAKSFTSSGATAWNVPQQVTVTGVAVGASTITHAITTGTTDYPTSGSGVTLPSVEATVTAAPTVPTLTIRENLPSAGHVYTEATTGSGVGYTVARTGATTADLGYSFSVTTSGGDVFNPSDVAANRTGTIFMNQPSQPAAIGLVNDTTDEQDGTVTITLLSDSAYTLGTPHSYTATVRDDDPTVVSLARVDSGNIAEGGSGAAADAEFTVTLGRRLLAGETVEVPLVLSGGSNVTDSDVMVAKKTNARGRITVNGGGTLTPTVTFMGHDTNVIRTETLVLTALVDSTAGEAAETVTVALGPNDATANGFDASARATNVGGGADPHGTANTFDVGVVAGVHLSMAVSGGDANNNAVENAGDATEYVTITLTLDRALTGSETVTVPLTVNGATVTDDYTFALEPSSQTGVSLSTSGSHSAQNPAVEFASGGQTATLRLTAVDNSDRSQPAVSIAYGTGGRAPSASGITLGARSGSPLTVVLVDDESGAIIVPADWALKPAGVAAGEEFRLLFVTSEGRTAESMSIADYNAWVQNLVARNGHAQLKEYGGLVKVLGSTSSSHARDNTGMWSSGSWADGSTTATSAGTEIYWLRASPNFKVADNYFDFCDGSWDGNQSEMRTNDRTESGAQRSGTGNIWTGTQQNCSRDSQTPLGGGTGGWANRATFGTPYHSASGDELDRSFEQKVNSYAMYGMSPVFQVEAAAAVTVAMSKSGGDSNNNAVENAGDSTEYVTVTITLGRALTGSETVTVPLTVEGATVTDDYTFALEPSTQTGVSLTTTGGTHTAQDPAVAFASGGQTATLRLTPVNNVLRTQPYVVIDYATGATAPSAGGGVTLGDVTGNPIGVVLVDDETGDIEVPSSWGLAPSGLSGGDDFRLLFRSSSTRDATSTDIADYDAFIREVAATMGHADIVPYAGFFKVFGSTIPISARRHNGMDTTDSGAVTTWADGSVSATDAGTPIYWLGAAKVADNYADFCDNSWDNFGAGASGPHDQTGTVSTTIGSWTGSLNDCGRFDTRQLGRGFVRNGVGRGSGSPLSAAHSAREGQRPLYGMSPVFQVEAAAGSTISFAAGLTQVTEGPGRTATVTVNASPATTGALTVNYTVLGASTATPGDDYTALSGMLTFPASSTSADITVTITNDSVFEESEQIRLRLDAGTDYTLGSRVNTIVLITDDDLRQIRIENPSFTVLENAGNAGIGIQSDSVAGYDIVTTLTPADGTATGVSGGTGADYDSDAVTATLAVGSSSHTINIPITDDNVAESDKTFTVTLSSTTPGVTVDGNRNMATVTIADDDHPQGLLFDPPIADGIEVQEASTATYTVRPTTLPTGNVVVTVTGAADGITVDADGSGGNTLTFTPTNWYIAQTVTVSAADDVNNANEMITLVHAPVGGGYTAAAHSASYPAEADDDEVAGAAVTVTMSAAGGNSDGDIEEGMSGTTAYKTVTIMLDRPLTASETVTVPLMVSGAPIDDFSFTLNPASGQTGVTLDTSTGSYSAQDPAVVFSGVGAQTATLRFLQNDNSKRSQPAISITYGMVSATGTTLAGSEGAPITFSIVDDETGAIVVPADWALKPSGVAAGEEFRLIFITSEERTAESTDIENYNDWAQELVARGGHAELQKYGGLVKVLGSTASTDASENLGMHDGTDYEDGSTSASDSGVAVYWLAAPPTNKVADNYFDFFDRSWDGGASGGSDQTSEATIESGAARSAYTQILSGTQTDGRADSTSPLGGTRVWIGETDGGNGGAVIFTGASTLPNTDSERMLAMSPVFQVEAAAAPVVSVELVAVEGARTPTGEVAFGEGEGGITPINFPVTADPAPTANLTVCVQVAESGHGGVDRVAASAEGIQTVTITSSGSVEHMVAYSNTAVDEPDSIVTVTVLAPETVGCSATAGSYTVSTTNPSDKARIVDDEPTVAELTSSDMIMVEGIPAGTAEVTVSLARRLYEGEVMEIELRLSTATGAVLPHVASPDFTVSSATGSGVALSDATTAAAAPDDAQTAPKVTFTGDNANTVQTATVTFAPTAGRDSDSMDETITVSLAPSLTLVGAAGSNVGGGATRHASNYMVDLTLAEAVAVSVSELRVAENGGAASYEVRLLTAPSGGDTTVTIGKVNGTGVNPDTTAATLTDKDGNVVSTLTFTSTDFSDAQVITVTGVDELSVFDMANDSPTYRDRSLQLTHTASGGGYSSQSLGDIDVVVQEAPQIEVYSGRISTAETPGPYRNGLPARHTLGVALQTDVFSTMDFFVRASDRPVGGEPITVTLSVASTYTQEDLSSVRPRSSDRGPLNTVNGSVIGMQLTRSSPVVQSLTLTFEDRPIGPEGCGILFNDNGEMGDGTPDSSFECPRIVYLVKTNPAFVHGCQDIDVTVSGGSVRTGGVYDPESITVHFWNGNRQIINDAGGGYKSACAWDSVVPRWSSPRPEPRTEYCVLGGRFVSPTTRSCFHFVDSLPSLDENSDVGWAPDNAQLVVEGSNTRYEIDLGVQVQRGQSYELELKPFGATMGDDYTLTLDTENSVSVSVDPNHPLDSATPRLIFSPGAQVASIIVEALDDTEHEREVLTIGYGEYRYKTTGHPDKVTYPQTRVRFAFIDSTIPVPTQPVSNLRVTADDATTATASWNKVLGATGYNVTYQGNATDPLNDVSGAFHGLTDTTITFDHNAAEQMVITVTVTPVHRANDGTTTTYHALSSSADLDLANPTMTCVPPLPSDAVTVEEVTRWLFAHTESKSHVLRWNRVLAALGEDTGETPLTVAESRVNEGRFQQSRWDRVTRTLEALEQCATPPTPVISITADGDITEGGDATYTLTANPTPAAPLDVEVSVTASGDYGVSAASHTVTIATTGAGTLTITTSGDSVDEPDGSVTATITDSAAYDVSATAGSATVAVSDDDAPRISITSDGDVTEGGDATFTLTASPAPSASLDVTVSVTQTGDYGVTAGSRTVTISTGGTGTLTVTTSGDSVDEPDGSVTATVTDGTVYDVSATAGSATVAVSDDDIPRISIVSGGDVTEGGDATFTLTASPVPSASLDVTVSVTQTGDYGVTAGSRTVTVSTGGTGTLTVATSDDSADEPDGSVTATVDAGSGYTVSSAAGAGTVTVSDDDAAACTPNLPSDAVTVSEVTGWRDGHSGAAHVLRWNRVLEALGVDTGTGATAMTVEESRDNEGTFMASRWDRVTRTLEAIEQCHNPPPPTPEVSITAGGDITEGGDATYTLTATPAPSAAFDVSVSVTQSGDYGVTPGSQTVTITTGGTGTLTVSTDDDSVDEADGSVAVTVDAGSGYTVSSTAGTASVAVADDDAAVCVPQLPSDAVTVSEVTGWRDGHSGAAHVLRWNRVLEALGVDTGTGATAMTVEESRDNEGTFMASRWDRVTRTLEAIKQCDDTTTTVVPPPPTPVVSIAGGSGVTEGGDATFTLTANPTPTAPLNVDVSVTASGDFGVTTGSQTLTIPTSGSTSLTITTSDDSADETDGSVTVTIDDGADYDVSATAGTATVTVADDDAPAPPPVTPVVSITADHNGVTEGDNATFTLTANPAPAADLDVTVSVAQSGDFGVTTGSHTVTIATGGTGTLTISTDDDSADEADGSVTVTIDDGADYDVSATAGTATVTVADDDAPAPPPVTPVVSITADHNGVTEGDNATFTLTANPAPAADLDVTVSVTQSGDFGVTTGSHTVTIATGGTGTLTISTDDDSADETDGSVTVTIDDGAAYTVSSTAAAATAAIADDDPASVRLPPNQVSFSVEDASATEGETLSFRVILSNAATKRVRVWWKTRYGGGQHAAFPNRDYKEARGWLTFAPGEVEKWVEMPLPEDSATEPNEVFQIYLGFTEGGATIADRDGTMTIIDND